MPKPRAVEIVDESYQPTMDDLVGAVTTPVTHIKASRKVVRPGRSRT